MTDEREPARAVRDVGDDAIALFRRIETQRREHPIPRPALTLRFASRLFDCVVYAVLALVLLPGLRAVLGRVPDPAGGATANRGIADLKVSVNWGPVGVDWTTAAALGFLFVVIVVLEMMQTRALGATVGKRLNRIRVARAGGVKGAGSLQIAVRSAVLTAPFVVVVLFWFGSVLYAWAGFAVLLACGVLVWRDEHQQGPHDKLARTEVFSTDVGAEESPGMRG